MFVEDLLGQVTGNGSQINIFVTVEKSRDHADPAHDQQCKQGVLTDPETGHSVLEKREIHSQRESGQSVLEKEFHTQQEPGQSVLEEKRKSHSAGNRTVCNTEKRKSHSTGNRTVCIREKKKITLSRKPSSRNWRNDKN